jgi:hypothetical protein
MKIDWELWMEVDKVDARVRDLGCPQINGRIRVLSTGKSIIVRHRVIEIGE